jgi:TonB-linked SusC/RagA family outer membrane protein
MNKFQLLKTFTILCLFFFFSISLYAQQLVTGKIFDERGNTLPGATIKTKKGTAVTIADINGAFSIRVPAGERSILISFTGYLSKEVAISGNSSGLKINLLPDTRNLSEVAVIGYQTRKTADLTGAISSINAETIAKSGAITVDQALQGRIAGLQMTENTGLPGGGSSIQIRGLNSINSTNEPIYVIDGVVISSATGTYYQNAFSSLNPADIASIDVLKDASATAIYGAQGANGVIIITTKRGKAGAPQITVDTKFSRQSIPKYLPMADLQAYAIHQNALYTLKGQPINDQFADPSLLGYGTNWQKEIFRPAYLGNYNLSLLGGNENTTYKIAGSYLNQDGIAVGSGFKRVTLNTSIDSKVKSWLKIGTSINLSSTKQVITIADYNLINSAIRQSPSVPARNLDGSFGGPEDPNDQLSNPIALANLLDKGNQNLNAFGNVYLEAKPLSWITYRSEYASSIGETLNHSFTPTYTLGYLFNSQITNNQSQQYNVNWTWRNLLIFDRTIAQSHAFNLMLAEEATQRTSNYLFGQRLGGNNDLRDLDAGDANTASNNGNTSKSGIQSYFGRFSYTYKDRYSLTGTLRFDGSSNFAQGHQWGTFPSAAAFWRISEEKFLKSITAISNLKLRVGYGKVGNSNIIPFAYSAILSNVPTIWGTGHLTANVPNPDVTWETTDSYNIGLDMGFLGDRIQLTADAYVKTTNNLLLALTLPAIAGTQGTNAASPPWGNVGAMQNKGFELSMNTQNIIAKNFTWTSNFVFSLNQNKVLKLNTENAQINSTYQVSGNAIIVTRTQPGQSIGMFYGYKVTGRVNSASDLYDSNGKLKVALPQGLTVSPSGVWVGDLLYDDYNKDGVINEQDRQFLGSPLPKFTYGFGNNFSYKNFDLSFFFNGVYGNKIINFLDISIDDPNQTTGNVSQRAALNWAKIALINPSGSASDINNVYISSGYPNIPRMSGTDPNANSRLSSRYLESGSYLRLQSLNFAYSLPRSLAAKIGLRSLKVYVSGMNLFTITKYSGYDPEVGMVKGQYSASSQNALLNGIDVGRYPSPRIYSMGLSVGI